MTLPHRLDAAEVVVIGGGPAGSAIGRLLASWGHRVLLLDKPGDRVRGLAESIPPSTRKLLAQIGVLDAVARAAFYPARGNTVWWASRERRVEQFGDGAASQGFQVFRPDLDRVLLDGAAAAGAVVESPAHVRRVTFGDDVAAVEYEQAGRRFTAAPRFVVDCSGRAGVVGRRVRTPQPGHRTYGLIGVWDADAWDLPDETHTVVETFADGWAWSVPTSPSTRHVGVMLGGPRRGPARERGLMRGYRSRIAGTAQLSRLLRYATLRRAWACDASLYFSREYAGRQFLLVGDAGSFIDPLSSFGVKKALASAWLGAVTIHTALQHPARAPIALDFFSSWERRVYARHLRRSSEFARAACAEHVDPFWTSRAEAVPALADDEEMEALVPDREIQRVFERFKAAPRLDLSMSERAQFEERPVVRGREIVLEPTLAGGMRFAANVDLLKLAEMAPRHRAVPDLFAAYCRSCAPVPLPNVIGALSMLVAKGILHERT